MGSYRPALNPPETSIAFSSLSALSPVAHSIIIPLPTTTQHADPR